MQSDCDLCGNRTFLKKYVIEGAEVNACPSCGKFGRPIENDSRQIPQRKIFRGSKPLSGSNSRFKQRSSRPPDSKIKSETFLKEDFGELIQTTRERLGLTRKEVSESLFIRENLLARIESGKYRPNDALIKKLEKILEISLIERGDESFNANQIEQKTQKKQMKTLTLGDFAHIRKKK